jgi:hypothetical protein
MAEFHSCLFLHTSGGWKAKVKVVAGSVLSEGSLSVLCCIGVEAKGETGGEGKKERERMRTDESPSSYKATNSIRLGPHPHDLV